jgi:type II secretory pathway component PulJ
MGSQTVLDLIGSSMVFGLLLLMTIRINASNSENIQSFHGDLIVQQNLVTLTSILEFDFRKLGYCKDPTKIPDPSKAILQADSNKIRFLTDLNNDGTLDSLSYYIGPTSEASATPNPNDHLFYRVENNKTPGGVNLGVTKFDLRYFDAMKHQLSFPIANRGLIQLMQITIQCETYAPTMFTSLGGTMDKLSAYQSAYWRQVRMVAKNLRNR